MIKKLLSMLAVALTVMLILPTEQADARGGRGGGGGGGGGFRAGGGGGGGGFGGFRAGGGGGGFRAMSVARPAFRSGPSFRPGLVVRRPISVYRPVRVVRRGYGAVYYGGNGCEWLRRRALVTGSPYWWSRYNACIGYY